MTTLGRILGVVVLLVGLFYLFGPYEDSDLSVSFDDAVFDAGVATYFKAREDQFDDITPGTRKRVIWFDAAEEPTEWVVVYLHGFSATSEEIRPVADQVADALEANLIYTRLTGHGRGGDAMAEATVADWMQDVAEALAAARKLGDRTLVLATSTGGTLAAAAAVDGTLNAELGGIVFFSPNFGVNHPAAAMMTFPAARLWVPLIAGRERGFEPLNADHGRFWTTRYPSVAALPMAALVQEVRGLDLSQTQVPALFWFSDDDRVVRSDLTRQVAQTWGGPVEIINPELTDSDDPYRHVITGDIVSPGQTQAAVEGVLNWVGGL